MSQTATAAVLCWACPYPARRPGCKGPPPSKAHTDRLLLPEIRSTGTDSPESVVRRTGSRWPAAQPAASSPRSASVSWVGATLLPAGPHEGGVAAVFRGPGVQATTMPEGNDREHDGHHRQGHGFGGEDAPARRAHVEIVLTPVRGVKAAMNVPTVPRQVCPGRCLQAWCRRGSNPQPRSHERAAPCMEPVAWSGLRKKSGFVLVSRSVSGGLR